MNPAQIIARKRDGHELDAGEIAFLITGLVDGSIPEYQIAAFAMAVYFQGMTDEETTELTRQMLQSGMTLSWPDGPPLVDKHSTGGTGDKVSLVLAPLLACCGLRVPMISGRGLGPTGGTLDKLESIPGFRTDLSIVEMQSVVDRIGCVITGASNELVPADRKLYALRDVTGTVPSIPLITASIMSKKLAESLDALVLDVKWGSGAFMRSQVEAEELASSLVRVGRLMGVETTALITDMNQPLGRMCGNSVEVNETVVCLQAEGPHDLRTLTIELGAQILMSAGVETNRPAAMNRLAGHLDDGSALEKYREMLEAQGGTFHRALPVAAETTIETSRPGVIQTIDTTALGNSLIALGGGRRQLGDSIDHSVGFEMLVRLEDEIESGQPLMRVFADEPSPEILDSFGEAITVGDDACPAPPLIASRLS